MTHPDGTNRPDPAASAPGLIRAGVEVTREQLRRPWR